MTAQVKGIVHFLPIADVPTQCHSGGMPLQVRTASCADIKAMHHLRLAVRENRLTDRTKVTQSSYSPYVAAGSAWVAETGDQMLGFAAADGAARQLWALFVAPEAEASGVGRKLHQAVLGWARAQGIEELWLTTSEGTRAERFYERAGWEKVGSNGDGEVRLRRTIPRRVVWRS